MFTEKINKILNFEFFFLGKLFPTLNNKIKYDIYQTHIKVVGKQTTLRNLHTLCNRHLSFIKFKTYFEDFGLPRPPFIEPPVELMVLFGF